MLNLLFNSKKRKITITFIIIAILFYFLFFYLVKNLDITKEKIDSIVRPLGVKGIILIAVLQFLVSMTPLPDTLVILPALILFGPIVGSITSVVGIVSASIVHFNIAKKIKTDILYKWFPISNEMTEKFSKSMKLEKLILFNIFSFVSFDMVAYLAGISGVNFVKFMLASILALIPIMVPNILISIGLLTRDPLKLVIIWILTILSIIVLVYFSKRFNKRFNILNN